MSQKSNKDVIKIEKNGKRMGRPLKAEDPRNVSLHLRISSKDAARIQKCADALHLNRTDAIMRGIAELEKAIGGDCSLPDKLSGSGVV